MMKQTTREKHVSRVLLDVTLPGFRHPATVAGTPTMPSRDLMEIDVYVRVTIKPSDLIDTDEAAEILDMTPRAVRKKIQRGQLPAIKVGGKYFLHPKAPLVYMRFQNVKAISKQQHS